MGGGREIQHLGRFDAALGVVGRARQASSSGRPAQSRKRGTDLAPAGEPAAERGAGNPAASSGLVRSGGRFEPVSAFEFVRAHQGQYVIARMCLMMGVSTSGYYAWQQRLPGRRAQQNEVLSRGIGGTHAESRQTSCTESPHSGSRFSDSSGSRKRPFLTSAPDCRRGTWSRWSLKSLQAGDMPALGSPGCPQIVLISNLFDVSSIQSIRRLLGGPNCSKSFTELSRTPARKPSANTSSATTTRPR